MNRQIPLELEHIGKRLPYQMPNGTLDALENVVLNRTINTRQASAFVQQPSRWWQRWIPYTIGVAAVTLVALLPRQAPKPSEVSTSYEQVDKAFSRLNETDQEFIIQTFEDEEFIGLL